MGQTPIGATPTNGRTGNNVSGSAHCIGSDSDGALVGLGGEQATGKLQVRWSK